MVRLMVIAVSIFAIAGGVTACGVKPSSVDPPPGAEETKFPRTYPDPATDPKRK